MSKALPLVVASIFYTSNLDASLFNINIAAETSLPLEVWSETLVNNGRIMTLTNN